MQKTQVALTRCSPQSSASSDAQQPELLQGCEATCGAGELGRLPGAHPQAYNEALSRLRFAFAE